MAKHAEPTSGRQHRAGRHPNGSGALTSPTIPRSLISQFSGPIETLPTRLVVARSQLEQLPDIERRLFANGLAQVIQRHTTSPTTTTVQRQPDPLKARASTVQAQLRALIAGADWPTIRRRVYPQQSAAGIARAKDRKAGRAPDLTGLGKITSLERFAGAMKSIQADWPNKTVRERLNAVGAAANAELVQAGVPKFLIVDKEVMSAKGSFTRSDWAFHINEDLVNSPTLDAATAGMIANAAMHESRHAEQHFLAARFSAGFNKTDAAGLVAEQGINPRIAAEAVKQKLTAKSDASVTALGRTMHKAFVTDKAATAAAAGQLDPARDVMDDKRLKAEAAQAALTASITAATVAAAEKARDELTVSITDVERAYAAYRAVPYEADAHEVGDAAEQAFQGWP